ncbi:DUF4178 domain-containing protein [Flavobacterium nitrogenifigens]|uniref:DUF4178 domain-containing protein n=1 Tax=Flavobacterium nitrogenifigens TaxID=1617283 RepID=A0A521CIT3_9FLAO|nr:DUF4178 domain-containing protein [Flavobacterium nitrogenifigens]KAF2328532.1 DUF4178 domain-containing protein [Flavobacterium nitrogenifigens]SMO59359.1 protein of unknown function [Flavobacterium nitrogenifigens]
MKIPCYDCNVETELEVGFEVVNFVCPICRSLYEADDDGKFRRKSKYKAETETYPLVIGETGFLKGSEYKVTGILRKKVHPDYRWTEFILQNEAKEFLYLSVSNGHWMMLTEMEKIDDLKKGVKVLDYEGQDYDLFEHSDAEIIDAKGFFDFQLSNKKIHLAEFINPPYIVSVEKMNNVQTAFHGEYASKSKIRKAFPGIKLPYQFGTGMIQPSLFDLKNTAIIFCLFALLIITANWYIYKDQVEQNVFNSTIKFSEFDNKEITTPSFVLKGASAPMTISVSTGVNNSWANLNIALINEDNGDEIYANKDIEYYYGYSEGESWTEGSQSEKFNICGVKAGRYHLSITPMKAPEDLTNSEMNVKVVWNQPSNRNVWLVIIAMVVIYFIIRYFKNQFEKKRWSDSSYSTYE